MTMLQTALMFLVTYYAQVDPGLHKWFESLRSDAGGYCCAETDGIKVDDPNWGEDSEGYWVSLDGIKVRVPPGTVIYSRNPEVNYAVVWATHYSGVPSVRCFLPGEKV